MCKILTMQMSESLKNIAKKIKLLMLDVDGVLTDGTIYIDSKGEELKAFNVRDGQGIKLLMQNGVAVAIVSARGSKALERRTTELGILELYQNCTDKLEAYRLLKERYALKDSEIAYMGDDIVDIGVLRVVGLPITVADAKLYVKKHVLMVTEEEGGHGAVREVADFILASKGILERILNEYNRF
ncbi:MAG: HAD-IIIA family hydrolase [Candidatus Magnetoovum sp. WYHC-5]|nr:HAD-IIIA family hydrolase [Candidatus Magnetoovum sp. WYHC-5]